jgi:hypothetical protein
MVCFCCSNPRRCGAIGRAKVVGVLWSWWGHSSEEPEDVGWDGVGYDGDAGT